MTGNAKPASVPHMSPELIAILAVGVALAGIMLAGLRDMRREMNSRFDGVNSRIDGLDERLRSVEAGLAEVKGQLTIVRDYIAGRNTRADEPPAAPAE